MISARLRVEPLSAVQPGESFAETWDRCARAFGDVYYERGYLRVAALNEAGPVELALFEHGAGTMLYPFVRRPLEALGNPGGGARFDLVTPYEYGGPLPVAPEDGGARALLQGAFAKAFSEWCRDSGVVSEFVRFHPLLANHRGAEQHYDLRFCCANVVIYLAQDDEAMLAAMRSSARRAVHAAARRGCRVARLPATPAEAARFGALYRSSMDRLGARQEYYFSDGYFAALAGIGNVAPLFAAVTEEGDLAAASVGVAGRRFAHHHLTGADRRFNDLKPANLLVFELARHFREQGCRLLHLGGAAASQPGIKAFKEGFSPDRRDYFVGCRIFNVAAYRALSAQRGIDPDEAGHFPAYRRPAVSARAESAETAHARIG